MITNKKSTAIQAYRARILHFIDNPLSNTDSPYEYFEDGVLVIQDGHVLHVGDFHTLSECLPEFNRFKTTDDHIIDESNNQITSRNQEITLEEYPNHLIIPGFIDSHIHYPQTQMIGAYGDQLLEWLNNYTFPTEQHFDDEDYASDVSSIFLNELLRNGTTTALVFGTVHKASVNAFFSEAQKRGLRMIAGKVMMDRNAPEALCDTPETSYQESKELIERWHNVDRLQYAVTPRFAPTSSPEQLHKAAQLLDKYPSVYLHTHLSENQDEIAWVNTLFPESSHYLGVYDDARLVRKRSIFAHGVHLCDNECARLAQTGAAIAHCPTSNLFLGSGLFDLKQANKHNVTVGLGTDIGAGTSFSMFKTMDEAYKIQQLRKEKLDPFTALYLSTLGGARALDIEDKVGNFAIDSEADFVVLDLAATPLLKFRTEFCQSLSELLFALNTLGDDRLVAKTFAMGQCVHDRDGDNL